MDAPLRPDAVVCFDDGECNGRPFPAFTGHRRRAAATGRTIPILQR